MAKPTILLVGGAWHTADYFDPLVKVFNEAGYPTVALGLPSAGASLLTDCRGERNHRRLPLHGRDCRHRYFSWTGKPPGGDAGGVLALVYIAAMIPTAGHSLETHQKVTGNEAWAPARQALSQGGMMALPVELVLNNLYDDIVEDQAKHWSSLLKPQSTGVFHSPLAHKTYKEIPSGYLLTAHDKTYSYDFEVKTVDMAGFPKEMTRTIETGHIPWLTSRESLEDLYVGASRSSYVGIVVPDE